ncbi:hypothetical protein CSC70_03095 [Pseudoxanthomonas kalamensis DSM 18571]|uniref:hypothetical protein n=1 Tax=Pseudoxanthomonas kalamensis TaxID=289483 RepID=UPI0013908441|nr:hypothetical protein [Pseudoxanthomonas kalamensis]KAF1712696.1 hypothetical protein CSC70_03095 [Pseudoxanthomonas kalamensis DSM 18571]
MSRAETACLLLFLLLSATALPLHADEVVIYRCTDASGHTSLRDSPCLAGETQEIRSMQRPKDPPPALAVPAAPADAVEPPSPPREVQVVYRAPPRPMYECVTPEGDRYDSDDGEGNPRWVPLWTLGYPPVQRPGGPVVVPTGGGTWVRDSCHMLPQQEACARLSDRRYEIKRRYHSALQSERRALDLEQRDIEARMNNDCGGY